MYEGIRNAVFLSFYSRKQQNYPQKQQNYSFFDSELADLYLSPYRNMKEMDHPTRPGFQELLKTGVYTKMGIYTGHVYKGNISYKGILLNNLYLSFSYMLLTIK